MVRLVAPAAFQADLQDGQIIDGIRMHNLSRRNAIRLGLLALASWSATSISSVAADSFPLAIGGYDPVAYFTVGKAVRGVPEIEYVWDEYRYRFLSAEHRELFKANPERYAPQFANFCAAALAEGEVVKANPEYWLISDGKLYIFGKPNGPDLFRQDLAGHIAKANENRSLILNR